MFKFNKMEHCRYLMLLIQLFFLFLPCESIAQQQRVVMGQVVDSRDGQPLIGASVSLAGGQHLALSDSDGRFKISCEADAILEITFMGYQKNQVKLKEHHESEIEILMEPELSEIQEVFVSTGYQRLPKERATGSFEQVSNELLNRSVSTGILQRLEDVTPGLVFNRGKGSIVNDISIRGRGTILSNARPLIVVDNFPYEGDIDNINPNDVETITVLKDAAAASIWGAKAGNGVIVITTKRGAFNESPKVSFNTNVTVGDKPDLFYQPMMSTSDFIENEKRLFENGRYKNLESSINNQPISPVVELLIAERDGIISEAEKESAIASLMSKDVRNDFAQYLYRKSINQQYGINLQGGTKDQRYYVALGYDNNKSTLVRNGYQRLTLKADHAFSLLKNRLDISSGIYFTNSINDQNNAGHASIGMKTGNAATLYPYAELMDEAGNAAHITQNYRERFVQAAMHQGFLDWQYRPLEELNLADNRSKLTDYRLNARIKYKVLDGLDVEALYQYNGATDRNRNLRNEELFYTRDLINQITEVLPDGTLLRPIPVGGILDINNKYTSAHSGRVQANYSKEIGRGHDLTALIGSELRDVAVQREHNRLYGYNDELATSKHVDYVGQYNVNYFPGLKRAIPNNNGQGSLTDRYVSYFANSSYSYKGKYILSGSGRIDMSNLFGVKANQRAIPLWSAGFSWLLSEENGYHIKALPYLKLRATYGFNGNMNKSVSAYTTARMAGIGYQTRLPYAQIVNPPNAMLQWERLKIVNFGIDFATKSQRVNGSLEYFIKNGYDLIGTIPMSPSSGVSTFTGNTASTKGRGFDLNLISNNLRGTFDWNTAFLFSHVHEIVSDYGTQASASIYLRNGDGIGTYPLKGKPLYAVYSYLWAGLNPENGNPMAYLNGVASDDYNAIVSATNPDNLNYNGPARPTYFGAIRNTFGWKDLSLSFNISFRLGYFFRQESLHYGTVLNGEWGHGDFSQRWQKPGDEKITQVPSKPGSLNTNRDNIYVLSSHLVQRGDHIRLQDIRLDYSLKKWPRAAKDIKRLNLYCYANNIGLLWKVTDTWADPDFRTYPPLRSISLGLSLSL